VPPYQKEKIKETKNCILQRKRIKKANYYISLSVWFMTIGLGPFIYVIWSGNSTKMLTVLAVLGLFTSVVGIPLLLKSRDNKRKAEHILNSSNLFISANTRFEDMKKDSNSNDYRDIINKIFREENN